MATRILIRVVCLLAILIFLGRTMILANAMEKKSSEKSAQLIGEFKSYSSIDVIEGYIHDVLQKGSSWKREGDPDYERYEADELCRIEGYVLSEYSHLGYVGKLRFTFLGDRLVSTQFYPKDYKAYLKDFIKKYPLEFKETKLGAKEAMNESNTIVSYTTVESVRQYGGEFVISWSDKNLSKDLDRCLYRD